MVRLETQYVWDNNGVRELFTFQYGQIRNFSLRKLFILLGYIYIPVWLDQKPVGDFTGSTGTTLFTFQYGQIRNLWHMLLEHTNYDIYIPVWLDQKHIYKQ